MACALACANPYLQPRATLSVIQLPLPPFLSSIPYPGLPVILTATLSSMELYHESHKKTPTAALEEVQRRKWKLIGGLKFVQLEHLPPPDIDIIRPPAMLTPSTMLSETLYQFSPDVVSHTSSVHGDTPTATKSRSRRYSPRELLQAATWAPVALWTRNTVRVLRPPAIVTLISPDAPQSGVTSYAPPGIAATLPGCCPRNCRIHHF